MISIRLLFVISIFLRSHPLPIPLPFLGFHLWISCWTKLIKYVLYFFWKPQKKINKRYNGCGPYFKSDGTGRMQSPKTQASFFLFRILPEFRQFFPEEFCNFHRIRKRRRSMRLILFTLCGRWKLLSQFRSCQGRAQIITLWGGGKEVKGVRFFIYS